MSDQQGLKGNLTTLHIFTLAFGAMIGVAWITLLGQWIGPAGPLGAAIAFLLGGTAIALIAQGYIYVANKYPVTGGEVAYAFEILGPKAGFFTGWILAYTYVGICIFESLSVGWIVSALFPGILGDPIYQIMGAEIYPGTLVLGVGLTVLLTWLNYRGTNLSGTLQNVMTIGLLIACAVFIIAGFFNGDPVNLKPLIAENPSGWKWAGIVSVFAVTPFLFGGFNFAVQAIGERKEGISMGAVGFTLLLAIICGAVFYLIIIFSAAFVSPRENIINADLAAVAAFESAFQNPFYTKLILFAGLLGLISTWNSLIFACARILYSLGEHGHLPAQVAQPHKRFGTPHLAVMVIGVLTIIGTFGGIGIIGPIVNSVSITFAAAYGITVLSAIVLAKRNNETSGNMVRYLGAFSAILILVFAIAEPFLSRPEPHLPLPWILLVIWCAAGALFWRHMKK